MAIEVTETQRGFHDYGDPLKCSYGNTVTVRESSSASGPHLWLFTETGPRMKPVMGEVALHLNVEQARGLIQRIQTWLDEIPERWTDGEQWLTGEKPDGDGD